MNNTSGFSHHESGMISIEKHQAIVDSLKIEILQKNDQIVTLARLNNEYINEIVGLQDSINRQEDCAWQPRDG